MSSARSHASAPTGSGQQVLAVVTGGSDDVRSRRIELTLERAGFQVRATGRAEELAGSSGMPTDVVVLACDALGTEDLGAIDAAKKQLPTTPIVMVTTAATARDIRAALVRGADGIVMDGDLETTLGATVQAVSAGQLVVPPAFRDEAGQPVFSAREKQILSMVVLGFANAEIARRLYLAESTIKFHLSSAFGKLGVRSRKEASAVILDPDRGFGTGILAISSAADEGLAMSGEEPIPPETLVGARLRVPSHVVHRTFVRETVILDLKTGAYHKVNATGGRMLEVLDSSKSTSEAAARLSDEYDKSAAEIEKDICDFSADLLVRGLLERASDDRT